MEKERSLVSWRLGNLPKKERDLINKWLDSQQNINNSITNAILHVIDRAGVGDITSFETQKLLFQKSTSEELETSVSYSVQSDDILQGIQNKEHEKQVEKKNGTQPGFMSGLSKDDF